MSKKNGFTLIELVAVIVILGILTVMVAPKVLDVQHDARHSTVRALSGAINSGISIVYGKAAVAGIDTHDSGTVDDISVIYGYPAATYDDLVKVVDGVDDSNWHIYLEDPTCGVSGCILMGYSGQNFNDPDSLCVVGYFSSGMKGGSFLSARSYFIGSSCGGIAISEVPFWG